MVGQIVNYSTLWDIIDIVDVHFFFYLHFLADEMGVLFQLNQDIMLFFSSSWK